MSSELWKKNDGPGLFGNGGGRSKGSWSPGHEQTDMDGIAGIDKGWEEMEEKYYEDFDSRADFNEPPFSRHYPYGQKDKYEPQLPGETQSETTAFSDIFKDIEGSEEHDTTVDGSETNGSSGLENPYREEELQITNVRRGGHKRLKNTLSKNRFTNQFRKKSKAPPETRPVNCEECGTTVSFQTCVQCSKYRVWHEKDEGPMCYHEYKDLESRGHYDGTWDDHPENFTREVWQKLQEEKRRNAEIIKEMELDRKRMEELYKEHQKSGEQSTYEFLKNRFGPTDGDDQEDDNNNNDAEYENESGEESNISDDNDEEDPYKNLF